MKRSSYVFLLLSLVITSFARPAQLQLTKISRSVSLYLQKVDRVLLERGPQYAQKVRTLAYRLDRVTSTENLVFASAIIGLAGIRFLRHAQHLAKKYAQSKDSLGEKLRKWLGRLYKDEENKAEDEDNEVKLIKDDLKHKLEKGLKVAVAALCVTPLTLFAKYSVKNHVIPLASFLIGRPLEVCWLLLHRKRPTLHHYKAIVVLFALQQYYSCARDFNFKNLKEEPQYKKILKNKHYKRLKKWVEDTRTGLWRLWWVLFVL